MEGVDPVSQRLESVILELFPTLVILFVTVHPGIPSSVVPLGHLEMRICCIWQGHSHEQGKADEPLLCPALGEMEQHLQGR